MRQSKRREGGKWLYKKGIKEEKRSTINTIHSSPLITITTINTTMTTSSLTITTTPHPPPLPPKAFTPRDLQRSSAWTGGNKVQFLSQRGRGLLLGPTRCPHARQTLPYSYTLCTLYINSPPSHTFLLPHFLINSFLM